MGGWPCSLRLKAVVRAGARTIGGASQHTARDIVGRGLLLAWDRRPVPGRFRLLGTTARWASGTFGEGGGAGRDCRHSSPFLPLSGHGPAGSSTTAGSADRAVLYGFRRFPAGIHAAPVGWATGMRRSRRSAIPPALVRHGPDRAGAPRSRPPRRPARDARHHPWHSSRRPRSVRRPATVKRCRR